MDKEQEKLVLEALISAYTYFEQRDRMNAAVHLNLIRWSPITEKLKAAQELMANVVMESA